MQRTWYWIIAAIVVVLAIYFFMGRGTGSARLRPRRRRPRRRPRPTRDRRPPRTDAGRASGAMRRVVLAALAAVAGFGSTVFWAGGASSAAMPAPVTEPATATAPAGLRPARPRPGIELEPRRGRRAEDRAVAGDVRAAARRQRIWPR